MSTIRAIALIFGLLAAALIPAAPAAAHEFAPLAAPLTAAPASAAIAPPVAASPAEPASLAVPEPTGLTAWIVTGALALGGLALGRSPRRTVLVGLALLLALFAFEDALHSVHHGFDPKQAQTCTIAAASGHVSGVAVDGPIEPSVILAAAGQAGETGLAPLPLHRRGPDQGRAPPALPA
jgi:hypothetical protein